MDFFSEDGCSVVKPKDLVTALSDAGPYESMSLEKTALITFTLRDLKDLVRCVEPTKPMDGWMRRGHRVYRGSGWIAVRSPYGAPGTVMLLEELVAFGVKQALFIGYCGSIQPSIHVGDAVIPGEALREEGTSYHYLRKEEKSLPDLNLQRRLSQWAEGMGFLTHRGTIWTTDAPYRETFEKVRRYRSQGVLAVEMEMAAAFAFGMARNIPIGSILLVSDEVSEDGWRTGFSSRPIKSLRKRITDRFVECLLQLAAP